MSVIRELNERVKKFKEEVVKSNTVLVVDDEEVVLMVMEELLGDEWRVITAPSAEIGRQEMEGRSINVVVTDKNLPGINGIEFLREIKDRWRNTEVIIITGYASLESALEAIDLGAFDYITKPFESLDIVKDKVKRAFKKQNEFIINMKIVEELKNFASQIIEEAKKIAPDIMEEFIYGLKKLKGEISEKNTVLVLDSNPASLNMCTRYIQEMDFEVVGYDSPDEALLNTNLRKPDVLIMEKEISEYHFVDFIKKVKSVSPDTEIIVYTYSVSLPEIIEAVDAGISDYAVRDLEGFVFLGRKLKRVMEEHIQRLKFRGLVGALKALSKKALRTIKTPFEIEEHPPVFEEKAKRKVEKREKEEVLQEKEEVSISNVPPHLPTGERILIVDDEKVVRDVLREFLSESGFEVDEAESAERALEMFESGRYAVLIVDKNLPKMNGLNLIGKVKEKDEFAEAVIITGYESLESAIVASQLGVCEYITKPFVNLSEITDAINRAIQRREEKIRIYHEVDRLAKEYEELQREYQELCQKMIK